jgi:PIN domain nuclease of toxin-antitoxin system
MKYLLDTHIILWAATDVKRLSRKAKTILEDMANVLYFSPISLWEISVKHAKHPDQMAITSEQARELAVKMGFIELPVRSRHGVDIANLPDIHNDPFDRMLITQARSDGLKLVSHDHKVAAYGEAIVKV